MIASMIPEVTAALVAALATILSAFFSVRGRAAGKRSHIAANAATTDPEEETRLSQARCELRRQESRARWSRRAAGLLTFSHYVVGGVLASSFVQKNLTADTVGFLGVVVLVSSLIHQRYRPDVEFRCALGRAASLRALIRTAEDDLVARRENSPDAPTLLEIRKRVSDGLTRIEEAEIAQLDQQTPGANGA